MATPEQEEAARQQVAEYYANQTKREANAYQPTNGESPLTTLPIYGGYGGDIESGKFYAGQKFKELFGRNPTASELTMFAPAYVGSSRNVANIAQGDQAIAQYFQGFSNTPDQINKNKEDEAQKKLAADPKYYDSVKSIFQKEIGRDASQEELDHFGKLLATGEADAYSIQKFLQQQPEYAERKDAAKQSALKAENEAFITKRKGEDAAFQEDLSGKLAGYDKQYFGEQILPSIQQTFAKQGRSFDSSGFQNSATQSAQQQNIARQQYLAQIAASQYGDYQNLAAANNSDLNRLSADQYNYRQQNAYNDYANMVAQQQNLANSGIQARYQNSQNLNNRMNEITDYNTQQQAYNQYLAKYGKRNNGLGGILGMAGGAAIGGAFGGIKGAQLGATLGGSFGQGIQNSYGGSY